MLIGKGRATAIYGPKDRCGDDTLATVEPYEHPDEVTPRLVIPWFYRGPTGNIKPGDEVVFILFEDHTGIILDRMDGNWTGKLSGDVELVLQDETKGNLKCKNIDMIKGNLTLQKEGDVKVEKGDITLNEGDITVSNGSVSAPNGDVSTTVSLNSHVHSGVQSGSGMTGGPQ